MIKSIVVDYEEYLKEPVDYVVDFQREFEGFEEGDLIISGNPFDGTGQVPIELELGIRKNGEIIFRKWKLSDVGPYFHTGARIVDRNFTATEEQTNTVSGLSSGRLKFDGLKLKIGASVFKICPFDQEKEEKMLGEDIYLN